MGTKPLDVEEYLNLNDDDFFRLSKENDTVTHDSELAALLTNSRGRCTFYYLNYFLCFILHVFSETHLF